jgi:hypothetical protein
MTVRGRVIYSSLTCLRGPVNGGAEKEKDLEPPESGEKQLRSRRQVSNPLALCGKILYLLAQDISGILPP